MAYCGSCQMSPCSCNDDILTLPTGSSGLPGPQGVQGAQGSQGIQGIAGANGAPGPTTCRKIIWDFNPTGPGVNIFNNLFITSAGGLSNVYYIDPNGIVTANQTANVADFVWQVWRWNGVDRIDARLEGTVTSISVNVAGDVSVTVTMGGSYKLVITG